MNQTTLQITPVGDAKPAAPDDPMFGVYERLLNDGRVAIPDADLEAVRGMNRAQRRAWLRSQRRTPV